MTKINESLSVIASEVRKTFGARPKKGFMGHEKGSGEKAVIEALKKYGITNLKEDNETLVKMVSGLGARITDKGLEDLLTSLGHKTLAMGEVILSEVYEEEIKRKKGSLKEFSATLELDEKFNPKVENFFKECKKHNGDLSKMETDKDLLRAVEEECLLTTLKIAAKDYHSAVQIALITTAYNESHRKYLLGIDTPEQFANSFADSLMEYYKKEPSILEKTFDWFMGPKNETQEESELKKARREAAVEIGKILQRQYPDGIIKDALASLEAKPDLWDKFMHYLTKFLTLGLAETLIDRQKNFEHQIGILNSEPKKSVTDGIKPTSLKEHAENKPEGIQQGK